MKVYITMISEVINEGDYYEERESVWLDTVWTNLKTAKDRLKQMADEQITQGGYESIESISDTSIKVYDSKYCYTKYYIEERELEDN